MRSCVLFTHTLFQFKMRADDAKIARSRDVLYNSGKTPYVEWKWYKLRFPYYIIPLIV